MMSYDVLGSKNAFVYIYIFQVKKMSVWMLKLGSMGYAA